MTARIGASMWVLLSFAPGCALAAEADLLSGRYGHDASEPAYQAVWEVSRQDQGWLARSLSDGAASTAYRLSPAGRRAFWEKMYWPSQTADTADCVTWGEAARSLQDMLVDLLQEPQADARPKTGADVVGTVVVCHVPAEARKQIGWLQDRREDWFYYDFLTGLMEVRRLSAD